MNPRDFGLPGHWPYTVKPVDNPDVRIFGVPVQQWLPTWGEIRNTFLSSGIPFGDTIHFRSSADVTGRSVTLLLEWRIHENGCGGYLVNLDRIQIQDNIGGRYYHPLEHQMESINAVWVVNPPPPPRKLSGAVRLWRAWNLSIIDDEPALRAVSAGMRWPAHSWESHAKPARGLGHVGFHGFKSLNDVYMYFSISQTTAIVGSFIGWGSIVVHEKGMKTQFAQVETLIRDDATSFFLLNVKDRALPLLAEKYRVPLITTREARQLPLAVDDFTVDKIRKSDKEIAKEIESFES